MARDASGRFFSTDHLGACAVGIAKAALARTLTAELGKGSDPTPEDLTWAMKVLRERPDWAEHTLKSLGL